MKKIPLTKGKFAVVDDIDYKRLSQHKWYAYKKKNGNSFYAARTVRLGKTRISIHLHREILGLKKGDSKKVDHANGDGLDNRRCNLRTCTHAENLSNQRHRVNCTSKYKGVHWYKARKKWMTQIGCRDKRIFLGYFNDETDAARAYDEAAIKYFSKFACLNFPKEVYNELAG